MLVFVKNVREKKENKSASGPTWEMFTPSILMEPPSTWHGIRLIELAHISG
jgi:hypothetical protein